MTEKTVLKMSLDPNKPEGNLKLLGGGKADEWNDRLSNLTVNALPIAYSKNKDVITEACLAISYGTMDMAPADPLEGILIAQLMVANEAALAMYQKGREARHHEQRHGGSGDHCRERHCRRRSRRVSGSPRYQLCDAYAHLRRDKTT